MREAVVRALDLRGIHKRFGRAEVLRGVSLGLSGGECHALAGENGAGKSTLVKIVSGALGDFEGTVTIGGVVQRFPDPRAARRAGVATIHQELSLVGSMSIADNLALGRAGPTLARFDRRRARRDAERALALIGLDVSPDAAVESLAVGAQQLVEIAKALAEDARIFVFDEPTSALTDAEAARLFAEIDRLKRENKAILFVSHRASDLDRIADRVTVLRDGEVALSRVFAETSHQEIVAAMLGERGQRDAAAAAAAPAEIGPAEPARIELGGARVSEETGRIVAGPIDLRVAAGELVGLTGLRGAGAGELLGAIFGADLRCEGSVVIDGAAFVPATPRDALARRVAFVPADRKSEAVIGDLDAIANLTLASLPRLSPGGVLSADRERRAVAGLLGPLGLDRVDLGAPLGALSGGTQQKIILARALATAPRVLLLDEPTRGVDVAAKAEIHAHLRTSAANGLAVVFATTDLDELFALASRIVVFARGRVALDVPRAEASREGVLGAAMGREAAA